MKKSLLLFVIAVMFVPSVNAQSWKSLLNKVADKVTEGASSSSDLVDGLSSVLSSAVSGTKTLKGSDLVGTWTYRGVACKLESDDVLMKLASGTLASKIEEAADAQIQKLGVKPGSSSVTFNSDGTCVVSVKGYDINATYSVKENNRVALYFVMGQISTYVDVEYDGSNLSALCDADKLLAIIKKLSSSGGAKIDSESMNAINLLSTLVDGYNGLKLGMKLSK